MRSDSTRSVPGTSVRAPLRRDASDVIHVAVVAGLQPALQVGRVFTEVHIGDTQLLKPSSFAQSSNAFGKFAVVFVRLPTA